MGSDAMSFQIGVSEMYLVNTNPEQVRVKVLYTATKSVVEDLLEPSSNRDGRDILAKAKNVARVLSPPRRDDELADVLNIVLRPQPNSLGGICAIVQVNKAAGNTSMEQEQEQEQQATILFLSLHLPFRDSSKNRVLQLLQILRACTPAGFRLTHVVLGGDFNSRVGHQALSDWPSFERAATEWSWPRMMDELQLISRPDDPVQVLCAWHGSPLRR